MIREEHTNFFGEEIKSINLEKKSLTVEMLRSFTGFENVSDEEANEIILSLQIFSELFHEFYMELERMKECGEIKDIIAYLLDEEKIQEQKEKIILKQAA